MKSDSIRDEIIKNTINKIQSFENAVNAPQYQIKSPEEVKIDIRVDNKVAHGSFVPCKITGQWKASEQTFRAMKKDIFALGDSIDELVQPYNCQSCHTDLDLQFWHFCPYCGERFLI